MMSKSEAAFRFSAEKLFGLDEQIYFWTFTFKRVWPDWYYAGIWSRFILDVQDLYGGLLRGLKVTELHENHGVHYHALLNRRVWVGEVRRIGSRYGIGRVHVVVADAGAIDYLCKYLTKGYKQDNPLHARCARWGTIGRFKGTRIRDVEVSSAFHDAIKRVQVLLGQRQIPFGVVDLVQRYSSDPERLVIIERLIARDEAIKRFRKATIRPDWLGRRAMRVTREKETTPARVRAWVSWIEATAGGDE